MDKTKKLNLILFFVAVLVAFKFKDVDHKHLHIKYPNSLANVNKDNDLLPLQLSCSNIPYYFSNYEEATRIVRSKKYKIKDIIDPLDSDWIASPEFYSCDGKEGYFIYTTIKGRDYIHEKLPYHLFLGFKNADSPGSYYNKYIKKKYGFKHRIK